MTKHVPSLIGKTSSEANDVVVPLFRTPQVRLLRAFHFGLSDQAASRLYYAGKTYALGDSELFPMTVQSHADAIYDNAMRFLDSVRADESFQ